MTIRVATLNDVPAMVAIEEACIPGSWTQEQLASFLTKPAYTAFVRWDPSRGVTGHIVLQSIADTGEIITLAVHPAKRRKGTGRALLTHAQDHWRSQEIRNAFLEVRADNLSAVALYTGAGWKVTGRRSRYYRDGTDALVMAQSLVSPCG